MAVSISLAVLENLVHMSTQDFPVGYVTVRAAIQEGLAILTEDEIRKGRRDLPPRDLGDEWIRSLASAVLRVRSAVVRDEFNYLLNPVA